MDVDEILRRRLDAAERAVNRLLFINDDDLLCAKSVYVALAYSFLVEAQKEARGEPLRRMSPSVQLALMSWLNLAD
jgi:hypothetical protein